MQYLLLLHQLLTITVNVGVAGPGDQYAHTFKRASANAIRSGGDYLHQFVSGVTSCVVSGGNYLAYI